MSVLVMRDICENSVLGFRQRSFYAANRACVVANELTGSFQEAGWPIAVGAVSGVLCTTLEFGRDHAE